jgi:hypothetical protein
VDVHGDRGFCGDFLSLQLTITTLLKASADAVFPVDRGYNTGALKLLRLCTATSASVP